MSILFLMPSWSKPSEIWMQRMLEELIDHLGVVVAGGIGKEKYWREQIRAVELYDPSITGKIFRKINKLSPIIYNNNFLPLTPQKIVEKELQSNTITKILCHYGDFAVQFMNIWKSNNKPLFIHFHGYDATFDLRKLKHPFQPYFNNDYPAKLKQLSNIAIFIANSSFTKSLLEDIGIDPSKIVVKYLGVPLPEYSKSHSVNNNITILQLGRLVDFKGPDLTINAFEIACAKGLSGKLIIAGDGPLKQKCEKLIKNSKYASSILMVGVVNPSQAKALFSSADIYTQHNIKGPLSNQEECLGVSVLEAMSYGLPIVGTSSGGVKETVIDGVNGILVNPGDVEEQAASFLQLAQNPQLRQSYGDNGRSRIKEKFSVEQEKLRLFEILGI